MTEQQMLRSDATDSSQPEELWRNEIQARVARYKTRRGRRIEGTYSMRFPFGASEAEEPTATQSVAIDLTTASIEGPELETAADARVAVEPPAVATTAVLEPELSDAGEDKLEAALEPVDSRDTASTIQVEEPEPGHEFLLEPDPEPLPPPPPRPAIKRKVIAFPRQATNLEEGHRLADPVFPEQPRILDVPEELEPFPTTPLLDGLQLAASPSTAHSADHVDLPVAPATLSRRVLAGIVDCAVVLGGCAAFGAASYKLLPPLQPSKTLILGAAVIPLLLWAVYEYLLLMYSGTTLGMQVTKLRLSTFKGEAPGRRQRRSRVIGLYFSAASIMMGLLWSLVDVDTLCWHDRISHTYLTRSE